MTYLGDINFFLALKASTHPNYSAANGWFGGLTGTDKVCFCRSTEQGFLRLLTAARFFGPDVSTNLEAIQHYNELRGHDRIAFAIEPQNLLPKWFEFSGVRTASPKIWMDAYLAAFAVLSDMTFVTFDKGFARYEGLQLLTLD